MGQTYIARRAASQNLFSQTAAQNIEETTPPDLTPRLHMFSRQLVPETAPVYIPVVEDEYGLFGFCSDGVLQKIAHDGGDVVFGWTIWEIRHILFTAEFHAVWRSPTGKLLDITPKPMGESRIVFVPDESYANDFNFDNRPPNRRLCALESPDRSAYAVSRLADMKPSQRQYEERRARKAGQTIEDWLAARMPLDPRIARIEQFIAVCDEVDALMDKAQTFGEGLIRPSPKLIAAMKRKMELLELVRLDRRKASTSA